MSTLTTVSLTADNVLSFHAGLVDVYAEVFAESPWDETDEDFDAFARTIRSHEGRPDFRGAVLVDDDGRVEGFTYGHDWVHDNWWCEAVERDLGPRAEAWTSDCFHLCELAVRSAHRGHGYGADLYDALVADLPHRTSILSTNRLGPIAAATLYARRGWKLLLEDFQHCDLCPPVQVLGLTEPALSARSHR